MEMWGRGVWIIVMAVGVLEQQDEVVANKGAGSRPAGVGGRWAGDLESLAV